MPIPTYIINLKSRTDRRDHIINEFKGRNEFTVNIVDACEHKVGAIGLWNTIKQIIQKGQNEEREYVLICEDDHQFTDEYSAQFLFDCIEGAKEKDASILAGGIHWYQDILQISENIFWATEFTGTQFIIIFKEFFPAILGAEFDEFDAADLKMSVLTNRFFFIYPFISVQKEFGYSDATEANNAKGHIDEMFKSSSKNIQIMKEVSVFYKEKKAQIDFDYNKLKIATYIINVPDRTERRKHIESQFSDKSEFEVTIVEACRNPIGAVGLWQSIRKIVTMAIANDEDSVVICEDDHQFTEHYSKESFFKNIIEAYYQGADYLNGGVSFFDFSVPVSENRYWMNHCLAGQFLVVYSKFFKKMLEKTFNETVVADMLLSEMTSNKMFLYPSISTQTDFGYSDVTPLHHNNKGFLTKMFKDVERRMKLIQDIRERYNC